MPINITKIKVIVSKIGPDQIYFYTDLPEPHHPFKDNLVLTSVAASKQGEKYIQSNFPEIPTEIIKI